MENIYKPKNVFINIGLSGKELLAMSSSEIGPMLRMSKLIFTSIGGPGVKGKTRLS
jgi:hypothetical protein